MPIISPIFPAPTAKQKQDAVDQELIRAVEAYSLGEKTAAETGEKIDALLETGANINLWNIADKSLLIWACRRESPGAEDAALIEKMLKAGAKPDVAAPDGITPLLYALQAHNTGAVALLLAAGANITAQAREHDKLWGRRDAVYFTLHRPVAGILHKLAAPPKEAEFVCLKMLLTRGLVPDKDAQAFIYSARPHLTPLIADMDDAFALHAAAKTGDSAAVKALLDRGVAPDGALSFGGQTALAAAAENGHLPVIEQLLRAGADRNLISPENGLTPLLYATRECQREAFKTLIEAGADADIIGGGPQSGFVSLTGATHDPAMARFVRDLLAERSMTLQQNTTLKRPLRFKAPGA